MLNAAPETRIIALNARHDCSLPFHTQLALSLAIVAVCVWERYHALIFRSGMENVCALNIRMFLVTFSLWGVICLLFMVARLLILVSGIVLAHFVGFLLRIL